MLWLRPALFLLLVPGTVLDLVPFALVAGNLGPHFDLGSGRLLGYVPLTLGLAVILWCFADFVRRGCGTPAPYDPPRELVVAGLYRFVRNPQYLGVFLVVIGEALLTRAVVLFGYLALLVVGYHLFVTYYEEPTLNRLFGAAYTNYCESVPRWVPRGIARSR
jgi:protein-S-isoprenylcysteine O-methyltransferase Ste14